MWKEKKNVWSHRRLDPRPLTTQRAGLTHINEITLCRHHKVSKGALIHENKRFRVTSWSLEKFANSDGSPEVYFLHSWDIFNMQYSVYIKQKKQGWFYSREYIYIYMLPKYIYIYIYICCVKKRYHKKAVFLHWYIFVKGQLFYKNRFCKKAVIL